MAQVYTQTSELVLSLGAKGKETRIIYLYTDKRISLCMVVISNAKLSP
jgi:hypothetical protein